MSTPTHEATLDVIRDSLKWLRESLDGMPAQAVNWTPGEGTNSVAVLIRHALPSTVFWVRSGSGEYPSSRAYTAEERTPAFEATGETRQSLLRRVDEAERRIEATLRAGTEAHLAAQVVMDDEPDEPPMSGAKCLVHAASHLREHAGQAALTRELWLARAAG